MVVCVPCVKSHVTDPPTSTVTAMGAKAKLLTVTDVVVGMDAGVGGDVGVGTIVGLGDSITVGTGVDVETLVGVTVEVGTGIDVAVGNVVGVEPNIGTEVFVGVWVTVEAGVIVGSRAGVGLTSFSRSAFVGVIRHSILVHPSNPFVQKQLLHEFSPVSLPVQPLWTVSPPPSLHAACGLLWVFDTGADKVPDTLARVGGIVGIWVVFRLGVGSTEPPPHPETASKAIPITNTKNIDSFIPTSWNT